MAFSPSIQDSHRGGRASLLGLSGVWLSLLFVLFGVLATLGITAIMYRFEAGALIILALIVALPVAGYVMAYGLPQAIKKFALLRGQLTWWHWLWLVAIVGASVFHIRESQTARQDPVDSWAAFRILSEMLIASVLGLRLALRRPAWLGSLFKGLVGALAVYGLVCMISSVWSVFPPWTFYKSWEFLVDVSLLAAILATIDSVETFESLWDWTLALIGIELVWTCIGAFIWWNQLDRGRLAGVFPVISANAVGAEGAIIALVGLHRLLESGIKTDRSWYFLVFAFGIVTMIWSQTRNSLAGFAVALVLMFYFSKRAKFGLVFTGAITALLTLTSLGATGITYFERGQNEETINSLSGRTEFWSFAFQQLSKHPFTGLGAYAAGKFAVLSKLGINASTLHNDYMEVLVGTSFWGLIPLVVAVVWTWVVLIRAVRNPALTELERQLTIEAIMIMGITTVRSFFNIELIWHFPVLFLLLLGYAEFLRRSGKLDRVRSFAVP